jgi:hypothetical protein
MKAGTGFSPCLYFKKGCSNLFYGLLKKKNICHAPNMIYIIVTALFKAFSWLAEAGKFQRIIPGINI